MSVFGQATFRPVTVKKLFRERRSPTPYSPGLKPPRTWRESMARRTPILIWPLYFELVPAFPKPAQSAGFNHRPIPAAWTVSKPFVKTGLLRRKPIFKTTECLSKP